MITQDRLKCLLFYDPEAGFFIRKTNRAGRGKKGDIVGSYSSSTSYYSCILDGKSYLMHRLAWLYVYGEWPKYIDHINHDRLDNRMCNLRNTTYRGNARNKSIYKINKTGFNGVSWVERLKKYQARIKVDGVGINLGFYTRKIDAIGARINANRKYGFHSHHGKAIA